MLTTGCVTQTLMAKKTQNIMQVRQIPSIAYARAQSIPGPCGDGGKADDSGVDFSVPIGIRDAEGNINPYAEIRAQQCGDDSEARYAGRAENVPNRIAHLVTISVLS